MEIETVFDSEVINSLLEKYGVDNQLIHVQEELAELIVAISHYRRNHKEGREMLVEEYGDVKFTLQYLERMLGEADCRNACRMSERKAREYLK